MAPARVLPQKRNQNKNALKVINCIFISVATTVIILFFMPRSSGFHYNYEVNEPWPYSPLIANYQFAISKDSNLVKHERDSVLRSFQPYFDVDNEAATNAAKLLQGTKVKSDILTPEEVERYKRHISRMLDSVYSRPLLSDIYYNDLKDNNISGIRLISGNVAKHIQFKEIYSTQMAYEYIMGFDTARYKRPMMLDFEIIRLLQDNIIFNEPKSQEERSELINRVSTTHGLVKVDEKIVDRGEIVTPAIYSKLESYRQEVSRHTESQSEIYIVIGQALFVAFVIIMVLIYLFQYRLDYLSRTRTFIMPFMLMLFFVIIAELMVQYNWLNVAIVPFVMVPLIIRVFMDSRTALMVHIATVFIVSSFLQQPYNFVIYQILAGLVAIYSLTELSSRAKLMQTVALVVLTYCIVYTAHTLLRENDIEKVEIERMVLYLINGILLLFVYPLLWFMEKVFGMTSDVTLVELVNPNSKLLQELTSKAPGTYQHSLQVANLASEVAKRIGADAQLVRAGAMYHDIGKLESPSYFTENMPAGTNRFEGMEPQKSAQIIIQHTVKGVELAAKHHLPDIIKRFILTHHGVGKARFFYNTYKNEHPDEEIDEKPFTYPGPNPSTREEAILMMSDAIEAASRSISVYTEESISKFVDRIIDGQVAEGFYLDSPLTFKDISIAKATFKERLKIIYHSRIVYPELTEASKKQIESQLDEKGKAALATAKALDEAENKEERERQAEENTEEETSANNTQPITVEENKGKTDNQTVTTSSEKENIETGKDEVTVESKEENVSTTVADDTQESPTPQSQETTNLTTTDNASEEEEEEDKEEDKEKGRIKW